MELSEEEIAEWVAKHLATAPERDEDWYESVMREIYLADHGEGLVA